MAFLAVLPAGLPAGFPDFPGLPSIFSPFSQFSTASDVPVFWAV
jgi:hypothetical protein